MPINDMRSQFVKAGIKTTEKQASSLKKSVPDIVQYDIVKDAEKIMQSLIEQDRYGNDRISLTTSQIRKFLTAVNIVKNKVELYFVQNKSASKLPQSLVEEVKFLKVNLLYQAGRDAATNRKETVKKFVQRANLERIIDDIGDDKQKFARFCKYVEALVAYHKYYGGKDK